MSQQEPHVSHQSQRYLSGHSSDIEFEAAEQLLQHSREAREGNGDSMAVVAEHRTLPDFATNFGMLNEDPGFGDDLFDHRHELAQNSSQDRLADAQHCPIIDPPALGQVCR